MGNKAKAGVNTVVKWIMNIVIIILAFFLVMTAGVMIGEIYNATAPTYDEDNFYYNIESERYFNMVDGYYQNIMAGYEGNKDMQEYYGVARYYELASLYRAYTVAGNTEQADAFLQRMQAAESDMGSWSITKEPIHKQLGIE
ncbi:MAG: hypothetical protein IJ379_06680 [Lachnospiraceae bacterium]|nr:hypothetical protein [Lachnospiraceae bacterium]